MRSNFDTEEALKIKNSIFKNEKTRKKNGQIRKKMRKILGSHAGFRCSHAIPVSIQFPRFWANFRTRYQEHGWFSDRILLMQSRVDLLRLIRVDGIAPCQELAQDLCEI